MATFKASAHWPHYAQEDRYYDKDTDKFYEVKDGKLAPVQNAAVALLLGNDSAETGTNTSYAGYWQE